MTELNLFQTASGQMNLDLHGVETACTLRLGPTNGGEEWEVDSISISNDAKDGYSTCSLYRNAVNASTLLAQTASGKGDTYSGTIKLRQLEKVIAVWINPDGLAVLSHCTMTVTGRQYIKQRLY